jgi:hypothetical protein
MDCGCKDPGGNGTQTAHGVPASFFFGMVFSDEARTIVPAPEQQKQRGEATGTIVVTWRRRTLLDLLKGLPRQQAHEEIHVRLPSDYGKPVPQPDDEASEEKEVDPLIQLVLDERERCSFPPWAMMTPETKPTTKPPAGIAKFDDVAASLIINTDQAAQGISWTPTGGVSLSSQTGDIDGAFFYSVCEGKLYYAWVIDQGDTPKISYFRNDEDCNPVEAKPWRCQF